MDKVKKGESWKLVKEAFYLIEFVNPRNDPLCIALQHIVMHCTALPFYRNLVHSTVSWWIVLHHIRTWKLTFFLVCLTLGFLPNLLLLDSGSFSVFESSKLARLEVRVLRFPRPRPRPRKVKEVIVLGGDFEKYLNWEFVSYVTIKIHYSFIVCKIPFSQEDKLLQAFTEQYFIVNELFC